MPAAAGRAISSASQVVAAVAAIPRGNAPGRFWRRSPDWACYAGWRCENGITVPAAHTTTPSTANCTRRSRSGRKTPGHTLAKNNDAPTLIRISNG